ncbi:MBL fold metallo-hydrolase [Rhodohalobacter sp. 8-1]|uniref:MBL fold metallo-hydrolase n=1 Tax=Rhodohalobacter sp. 8-1 TaxID=3131972 RepID=UPI0030ED87B2
MKEIKKEIFFYQAECGDASRVRFYGSDGKYHNVFIDAGYRRTFRNVISSHVKDIQASDESIDLWIVSHIHDDHIGGVEQFIKQIKTGESKDTINKWFYNRPRRTNQSTQDKNLVSASKSIRQGDILAEYLESIDKIPLQDIVTCEEPIDLFGLKIHVITPSLDKLHKLRTKYESEPKLPLEKQEGETVSGAKRAIKDDYHIQLNDFDLSLWDEDDSIENGSSISVLTDYNGIRTLWLADAHPSDIVTSLNSMGYNSSNKLVCDWVKVTHHGSKANNSNELYSLIDCENFLFSANGMNKHKLPTKESIARILRNEHRKMDKHYNLYFTHDNKVLRNIFANEKESIYNELNFSTLFSEESNFLRFEY